MNEPARPKPQFKLEDYPFRLTDNVRYADLDPNGHVNNCVYATYFETARVALLRSGDSEFVLKGRSWMIVHLAIDFRAQMYWPGSFDMAIGVANFGRTSLTFAQAVFMGGVCTATAESIMVLVDATAHKPTPLTPDIFERFEPWRLRV